MPTMARPAQCRRGFSLIELLTVLAILVAIAALATIAGNAIINKAHDEVALAELHQLHRIEHAAVAEDLNTPTAETSTSTLENRIHVEPSSDSSDITPEHIALLTRSDAGMLIDGADGLRSTRHGQVSAAYDSGLHRYATEHLSHQHGQRQQQCGLHLRRECQRHRHLRCLLPTRTLRVGERLPRCESRNALSRALRGLMVATPAATPKRGFLEPAPQAQRDR